MAGQYLRTNYRITGGLADAVTLGGAGFVTGSAVGGAGAAIGPLVVGSWSGSCSTYGAGTGVIALEAASVLASFFGCDQGVNGYKIFPFYIMSRLNTTGTSTSNPLLFGSVTTSAGASAMFIWAGGSDVLTYESDWSAHFNFVGLVVSGP
jgi:hypothetical protein